MSFFCALLRALGVVRRSLLDNGAPSAPAMFADGSASGGSGQVHETINHVLVPSSSLFTNFATDLEYFASPGGPHMFAHAESALGLGRTDCTLRQTGSSQGASPH